MILMGRGLNRFQYWQFTFLGKIKLEMNSSTVMLFATARVEASSQFGALRILPKTRMSV
jgi:hypothetical protein